MNDITLALLLLGSAGLVLVGLGVQVGRARVMTSRLIQIAAVGLMGGYLAFLWNQPILTRIVPTSAVIVLGNWLPLWGAFFSGICFATKRIPLLRRGILAACGLGFCVYSAIAPITGQAPECRAAAAI